MVNFEGFDLNMLEILKDTLDSKITTGFDIIGVSSLPFCLRSNVIKGIYDIKTPVNTKMLFGILYEFILYQPKVLKQLLYYLHTKLEIKEKLTEVSATKQDFEEILPGKKLRFTPDIYTNLYTIEIKTTSMYVANWVREVSGHYYVQLNAYLNKYKQKYGFIHLINQRVFQANIKQNDHYWNTLWEKYGYFLPVEPNLELYKKTIERAKLVFLHRDKEEYDTVEGPHQIWECSYCDPKIKEKCPNPIIRKKLDYFQDCDHCGNKIKKGDKALFRNEYVFCEGCFDYVRSFTRTGG